MNIRTVTKLVSLIQQIDKQYEILSDIQADGDTGGFTAVCLGCFVGDKNSKSLYKSKLPMIDIFMHAT